MCLDAWPLCIKVREEENTATLGLLEVNEELSISIGLFISLGIRGTCEKGSSVWSGSLRVGISIW